MNRKEIAWAQTVRGPASKQRDPIQGEFFNTDSITSLAMQLTREGIGQNPLDAAVSNPVRVRVHVSGESGALKPSEARRYFSGLPDHVRACDRSAAEVFDEPCSYLVIEDFNTTGLRGDPAEIDPTDEEAEENDFFYFFRAEGKSGKTGAARGRWGVGKYVFPMASHINSFFGLTVRSAGSPGGPGPLLMGQAVLKNHRHDNRGFEPDGWWAEFDQREAPVPIKDPETIESFKKDWNVSRDGDQGLTVVIPYVQADLGPEDLAEAIIIDYHLAILWGKLELLITSPELDEDITIKADSLDQVVARLGDEKVRHELQKQIDIAIWHRTLPEKDFIWLDRISTGAPVWGPDLIREEDREKLRDELEAGLTVGIRVPVMVNQKDMECSGVWSFFDVVLAPEPGHSGKPQFVREGLIVPEVSSPRLSDMRCLVLISDPTLVQMVGDAEGPAHANWSDRTQKFKGKYTYGRQWLRFIKRAPAEILGIIRAEDADPDRRVMARYFPAPAEEPTPLIPTSEDPEPEPEPGPGPDPDPYPPPPGARRFRVTKVRGGFSVGLTEEGKSVKRLRIRVAYDRRRGSPFRNWHPEDFDLSKEPIEISLDGGSLSHSAGNALLLGVASPESFALQVRGFDENRDLRVDVKVEEPR